MGVGGRCGFWSWRSVVECMCGLSVVNLSGREMVAMRLREKLKVKEIKSKWLKSAENGVNSKY